MNFKKEDFASTLAANHDFQIEAFAGSGVGLAFPLRLVDFEKASDVALPQECVGTHGKVVSQTCLSDMAKTGIWNLLQVGPGAEVNLHERIRLASLLVQNPKLFLENASSIILNGASGARAFKKGTWKLRSSNQKQVILSEIQQFVCQIPKFGAIKSSVIMIADELLTNSIFNAPFNDPEFTLDRDTLVVLDSEMSAEITIAFSEDRLFIGCLDAFGTFDCQHLLERMSQFSKDGMNSMNMGIGGAGIGLMRIIYLSSELYVVVEEGIRTLVGVSLPLEGSLKKVLSAPKSFFFQSFKSFGSGDSKCRIEKRDGHLLLRLEGKLETTEPINYIDIFSAREVTLDLRLLQSVDEGALRQLIGVFNGAPYLEKVCLEYVPYDLVDALSSLEKQKGKLIEMKSIWATLTCQKCKSQQHVVLKKKERNSSAPPAESPKCPTCLSEMNI